MPNQRESECVQVVHLSSAHNPFDTRIFWKECRSLAGAGYDVSFVVPTNGHARRDGVNIVAVKPRRGRLGRMLATSLEVVITGLRRKALIYHFHDPELIPGGLLLRAFGKRVIYDVHENVASDILFKDWIPRPFRRPISFAASVGEWIAGRLLSGVVAATPVIARQFPKSRTVLVQNFPRKSEFALETQVPHDKRRGIAYIGGLTAVRCAVEMVNAIARLERFHDVRLVIAGVPDRPSLMDELTALPGWTRVDYRGLQDRAGVRRVLSDSRAGLVLFHSQSYVTAQPQPNKLFEYMAAGLPVIAADFPNFRAIVETSRCGLCVPSRDVASIAAAIEWIFDHPKEAEEMGRRGREMVMHSLNWEHEEEELLRFYKRMVG